MAGLRPAMSRGRIAADQPSPVWQDDAIAVLSRLRQDVRRWCAACGLRVTLGSGDAPDGDLSRMAGSSVGLSGWQSISRREVIAARESDKQVLTMLIRTLQGKGPAASGGALG